VTWVGFVLGVFCGVFVAHLWTVVSHAWGRVNALHVERVELCPADRGLPRAFIRGALDEFHVRQMAPRGYLAWFREDTGEAVSSVLERRLYERLALARAHATQVAGLSTLEPPTPARMG